MLIKKKIYNWMSKFKIGTKVEYDSELYINKIIGRITMSPRYEDFSVYKRFQIKLFSEGREYLITIFFRRKDEEGTERVYYNDFKFLS